LEIKGNYKKIEPILVLPDDVAISMILYNFLTFDENVEDQEFYHPKEFRNLIDYKLDCNQLVDTKYYNNEKKFHIRNKVNDEGRDNSVEARSVDIMNYIYQIRHFYQKPRFMDYIDSVPAKKLVDGFVFNNELDMLQYRLTLLNPLVDYFVLVEATRTFTGETKPLYYQENKERFQAFAHKIKHIIVDDLLESPDIEKGEQWSNETYQRNCINRGIEQIDMGEQDYIIISDVDEIPDPASLADLKQERNHIQFANMKQEFYYYNLRSKMNETWIRAKILTYSSYLQNGSSPDTIRMTTAPEIILKGGWHLSYFGDVEFIQKKLLQFSHQEFNTSDITDAENLKTRIENSEDILCRDGVQIMKVPIAENVYLPPLYMTMLAKYM
jgi:beta-1,4-mannosyl-glycoprotein beta-1,4-N-acetylglucosaminyltransferase